ncbi:MAG: DUF4178 domain-containing protein [Gemmatimonadetes bacterium]|nr:DUF4178 domain-containing protein [Gemmatimonadota bacterium]
MSPVEVRGLNCPNCGAAIQLRGFQFSQSVVCDSCCAVLDASDANVAVLQAFDRKLRRYAPLIPLGTRGTWKGDPWEVIGFQVRQISVDGTEYRWHEYLLFNPYRGFRYLSQYDGHWNDIVPVHGLPVPGAVRGHPTVTWRDQAFKQFQSSAATTVFALGEFPWMVQVGDRVTVRDFVNPPFMLSSEETGAEVTWSLGEYVPGERLQQAFKLREPLPRAIGVFANQPNPLHARVGAYWKAFALLLLALVVLVVGRVGTASNRAAAHVEGVFHPGRAEDKQPFVSDTFTLVGHTSSVDIRSRANVDGSWLFLGLTLVNDSTGQVIDVGREVSYYHGVEDGESWSEGSPADHASVPAVPAGRWFLRLEVDGPDTGADIDWQVDLRRDAPGFLWWAIALVLLVLPPVVVGLRSAAFETTRWAESDFAPQASSGDDDSSSDDSSSDD